MTPHPTVLSDAIPALSPAHSALATPASLLFPNTLPSGPLFLQHALVLPAMSPLINFLPGHVFSAPTCLFFSTAPCHLAQCLPEGAAECIHWLSISPPLAGKCYLRPSYFPFFTVLAEPKQGQDRVWLQHVFVE